MKKLITMRVATLVLACSLSACGGVSSDAIKEVITDLINITNTPPKAEAGVPQEVTSGASVNLTGAGTDAEGDLLSYNWAQITGPSVKLLSDDTATTSFTAPAVSTEQTITIKLTVSDIHHTVNDTVDIKVTPKKTNSHSLSAYAGSDRFEAPGSNITLTGKSYGHGQKQVSYRWSQLSGPNVTITNSNQANANFTLPSDLQDENLTFQLLVTEDNKIETSDTVTISPSSKRAKNVILRVMRIVTEWAPFTTVGFWDRGLDDARESSKLKYYEATIWEDTNSFHLYAFPNEYLQNLYEMRNDNATNQEEVDYRESFMLMKFEGLPSELQYKERSQFLSNSVSKMASYITKQHPDANHHLLYLGHGGPGGGLFENQVIPEDGAQMLKHWSSELGRNLGVVDMGGPCNKGSLSDLMNFCQYADYYIASDLPNGGYGFDNKKWDFNKVHTSINTGIQFHQNFADTHNLLDALKKRIDVTRYRYQHSKDPMIKDKVEQANYLYECKALPEFTAGFKAHINGKRDFFITDDLLKYLQQHNAPQELKDRFHALFTYKADNRDYFEWEETANGLLMAYPGELYE